MPDPVEKKEPGPAAVPEVAAPVVAEPVAAVTAAPAEPVVPKKDWRDARIAELTAKLNDAKTAAPAEPVVPKADTASEADFEARVAARAAVLADETVKLNEWNTRCNEVVTAGKSAFPDFDDKLTAVKSVVNAKDRNEVLQYNEVLAAAIETGKAPELIHALGSDPGKFAELMKLSPVKRGMELAALATGLSAAPEPSNLPKPITPVGGKGAQHEEIKPDDAGRGMKLSKVEWFKRREAQAAERGIQ